jgi:hypothetical protein
MNVSKNPRRLHLLERDMFLCSNRSAVGMDCCASTTRNVLTSDHLIVTTEKLVIDL